MNKTEFIRTVAAACGQNIKDTALVMVAMQHVVVTSMQGGESIAIPGFGSFLVKERPARVGRNPRTGNRMEIAPKKVVKFNPGSELTIFDFDMEELAVSVGLLNNIRL